MAIAVSMPFLGSTTIAGGQASPPHAGPSYPLQVWRTRYDGPASGDDFPVRTILDAHERYVYVAGTSEGPGGRLGMVVLKLDAKDGKRVWAFRHDAPAGQNFSTTNLIASPDDAILYLVGTATGVSTFQDFVVVAIDARTGRGLWSVIVDDSSHGAGAGPFAKAALAPDGSRLYLAGLVQNAVVGSIGSFDVGEVVTIALDTHTQVVSWENRFRGGTYPQDHVSTLKASPDGSLVVVTAYSYEFGEFFLAHGEGSVVGIRSTDGREAFSSRFSGQPVGAEFPDGLQISNDGASVFVMSTNQFNAFRYSPVSLKPTESGSLVTVASYSTQDGTLRWSTPLGEPSSTDHFGLGFSWGAAGKNLLVVGVTPSNLPPDVTGAGWSGDDMFMASVDALDGHQEWLTRFDARAGGHEGPKTELRLAQNGSELQVIAYTAPINGDAPIEDPTLLSIGVSLDGVVRRVDPIQLPWHDSESLIGAKVSRARDNSHAFVSSFTTEGGIHDIETLRIDLAAPPGRRA